MIRDNPPRSAIIRVPLFFPDGSVALMVEFDPTSDRLPPGPQQQTPRLRTRSKR